MGDGWDGSDGVWCGLRLGCWCVPEWVRLEDEGILRGVGRI